MRMNTQKKGNNASLMKMWLLLTATLVLIGAFFLIWEPVNKKIWTIPFAFFTSALTGGALCLIFGIVDVLDKPVIKEKFIQPFLWLGMNPLFIYIAMTFYNTFMGENIKFTSDGVLYKLQEYIDEKFFNSWIGNEYVSSLLVAVLNLSIWVLLAYLLYLKKIFIKI